MKELFYFLLFALCFSNANAASIKANTKMVYKSDLNQTEQYSSLKSENSFVDSKKGVKSKKKKIGFFKKIKLSLLKKIGSKRMVRGTDIPQWGYVLMSVFWLGWLAMGIIDDWQGNNWWIALILYAGATVFPVFRFLGWLPGFIFCMIKMADYY